MVSKDVVGFGTAMDEKVFGIPELTGFNKRQREQVKEMEIDWKFDTLDIHISQDENTACIRNDVVIHI